MMATYGLAMRRKYGIALVHLLALTEIFRHKVSIAADAEDGKRIAEARCARCHFVVARPLTPAVAPSFAMIAVNRGFS
jgi:cytochrome c553